MRIYLQQRHDMGIRPSGSGVDGSVQINGRSSLTGDILQDTTERVLKFSETSSMVCYNSSPEIYSCGYGQSTRLLLISQRDRTIALSEIYGASSRDATVTLSLIFRIKVYERDSFLIERQEPVMKDQYTNEFPINIMVAMAQNLATPFKADVEFICKDVDGHHKSLYALRPILTARCEYYAKSSCPGLTILMNLPVFAFDKNVLAQEEGPSDDNVNHAAFGSHLQKKTNEDFNLLHNILYYLYTDHITFATHIDTVLQSDLPKPCPVEDIYIAADRMLLGELKQKALQFLEVSCTIDNITSRLVSSFSGLHEEVATVFGAYFRKNWDRIKNRAEFEQLFTELQDADFGEVLRVNAKFRELMKGAVFLDSSH